MYKRSLLGLTMMLLGASCVPPQTTGLVTPAATKQVAMLPPLAPMKPLNAAQYAQFASLADPLPQPTSPAIEAAAQAQAAPPFEGFAQNDADAARSLECLTAAVYYESRSEPLDGQRAVAQVVLNRVRNPAYPGSVCGVVYQGAERRTGCQFTFTCDGSMAYRREPAAWETAQQVAQAALAGFVYDPVGSATNYHADAIQPWWASGLTKVAAIGSQIFYKVSGAIGNALAFRQPYSGVEPAIDATPRALAAVTTGTPGTPALVRYSMGGGVSVDVHRGSPAVTLATMETSPVPGVRVHFGATSDTPDDVQEATASSVTVHRGPMTGAADGASTATPAPSPAPSPAASATVASDTGSTTPTPAG